MTGGQIFFIVIGSVLFVPFSIGGFFVLLHNAASPQSWADKCDFHFAPYLLDFGLIFWSTDLMGWMIILGLGFIGALVTALMGLW